MLETIVFAFIAAIPLVIGGTIGTYWKAPPNFIAAALALAGGALLSAAAFELFHASYEAGGIIRAAIGIFLGASVFIIIDTWLDRKVATGASGFALLAAVTLDGIPENAALGISLAEEGSVALLVAIFLSNLPESLAGAAKMREGGKSRKWVIIIWSICALVLGLAVIIGRVALEGTAPKSISIPLAFAGGAVIASLVDTLFPDAYEDGGSWIAWLTVIGFLLAFVLAEA